MIHTMFNISVLALMFNMIAYADQTLQQEIVAAEDNHKLIVMVNNKARDLCKKTVECWHKAGLEYNDAALDELLNPDIAVVDYTTMLNGLKSCLNEQWTPTTQEELALKNAVQKEHDLIQQEYEDLTMQMGTRRIKIKYYAKVVTDELVIGNTATINNLVINDCIKLPNLPAGVLQVTDGCLNTTIIPPFVITPGSIDTAQLADGAVTTDKIADAPNGVTGAKIATETITGGAGGNIDLATITNANIAAETITGGPGGNIAIETITGNTGGNIADNTITAYNIQPGSLTPETLSFHSVETVSTEPQFLLVYRGRIDADGTTISGNGFTPAHPNTGEYTITLSEGYSNATDYSVIVQPFYIGVDNSIDPAGAFSVTQDSGTQFTINFYNGSDGLTPANPTNPFSFFTIGTTP